MLVASLQSLSEALGESNATTRPLITAAICTYHRYDLIQNAILSLLEQSLPRALYDIIVIDNSTDRDASLAFGTRYRNEHGLQWVHESRPGLSNARNVAASKSTASFIAFLDDDATAASDWLASLLAGFERLGPTAAVIGGRVRPVWGAPRPAWLDDRLLGFLSILDLGPHVRFIEEHEWLVGANICYRVDRLRAAGGFDTALGRTGSGSALMSNDEIEMGRRLQRAGGRSGYTPDAVVHHFIDPARLQQQWFRRRMAWQAISEYVENPTRMAAAAPQAWAAVKAYMAHCPPVDRSVRALALPQEDAAEFYWQTTAIFDALVALLSGVQDPDEP